MCPTRLMKKIIVPSSSEISQYWCDVTGASLPNGPVTSIAISCGYGSGYDGDRFELHLSGQAADVVLPLLRTLLLDGAPLRAHRTESLLWIEEPAEKWINRHQRSVLLRELQRLSDSRKGSLASIVKRLEKAANVQKIRSVLSKKVKRSKLTARSAYQSKPYRGAND